MVQMVHDLVFIFKREDVSVRAETYAPEERVKGRQKGGGERDCEMEKEQ